MNRICDFDGCENAHRALGLCCGHYLQKKANRLLTPLRYRTPKYVGCSVEGCTRLHYSKGLCQTDYDKVWRKIQNR